MINHVRTLLMNTAGSKLPADGLPGEVYVPPDYKPVTLPDAVVVTRNKLFGRNPDRMLLNYRLREIMQVLHATELEEHVLDFDPRVTYLPFTDQSFYNTDFGIDATHLGGSQELYVGGDPVTRSEQLYQQWELNVINSTTVTLTRETQPVASFDRALNTNQGLSQEIVLPGTKLQFSIGNPVVGTRFHMQVFLRPETDLGVLLEQIKTSGLILTQLFGLQKTEPLLTYRNLWESKRQFPYQLGALALAMAARTEERRVQ